MPVQPVSSCLVPVFLRMAVPANRFGSAVFSPAQLKTIQEVITLLVFVVFSTVYLKNPLTWGQGFGFLLMRLVRFSFSKCRNEQAVHATFSGRFACRL
jgi:uncharacterized protein (DUF486 family)